MSADIYAAFMAEEESPKLEETQNIQAYTKTAAPSTTGAPATPVTRKAQATLRQKASSPLWQRDTGGSDVLFDAEKADSEDEFGDFQTAGDSTEHRINPGQYNFVVPINTASTNKSSPAELVSGLPDANSVLYGSSQPGIKLSKTSNVQHIQTGMENTEVTAHSSFDDDWGDFEQTESKLPPQLAAEATSNTSDNEWEPVEDSIPASIRWIAHPKTLPSTKSRAMPATSQSGTQTSEFERPTNVPPPSSLLQLLSSVFELIRNSNADPGASKSELASKVLLVFRVSGRIVAGRALRWKRDTVLAQSVRIGQSGRGGGMKLAAVNKSDATKEESGAEEMVRDWSTYAHEFNSILAQAGVLPLRVRLSSNPSLKTIEHTNPSGQSKQCALCGLKRTERLSDVDVDVDDLFGEFWVEHWGHKDCFVFWYSYKNMLGHR